VAYPQAWFQRSSRGQVIGSYSQVPIPKDGTPTWLPLIPEGRFWLQLGDDKTEVVDIKAEYLQEVVANFNAGFPGPAGVPVDQRADHSRNPEGAYAFYSDVRYEPGDGLWGLFSPTDLGKEVIASGALPYVSPVFSIGDAPDPVWGRRNILIDAALCTQPQFGGQPQMVLASAYAPTSTQTSEAAPAAAPDEGVSDMPMEAEELQAKIDEAVAAAKAQWEQGQADAAKAQEDELSALKAQIEDLQAKAGDAEALQAAFDDLKAKQVAADAQKRLDDATREFEALRKEQTKVLPDGSEQIDTMALTPEAVKIAAAAKANPLDQEAVKAMTAHMLAHSGFEMVTVTEGKPNLVAAAAPAATGAASAALSVAAQPWTDECKAFVTERMGAGVSMSAAYEQYCTGLLPK
jgi:hypothetical protein